MATAPDHWEVAPYPKGRFINGRFIGNRRLECADGDIAALLTYFDTIGNDLWPYPFGGWSETACCVSAHVYPKPKGKVTSTSKPYIDYDRAWIDLTYDTAQMMNLNGMRVRESVGPGLGKQALSRPSLYWSDAQPIQHGQTQIAYYHTQGSYQLGLFKLEASPASLGSVWGKVNSTAYTTATLGYSFGAETMLCTGAKVMRGSPGTLVRDWKQAIYQFTIKLEGWNLEMDTRYGTYRPLYLQNGSLFRPQGTAFFTWTSLRL